MEWQGWLTLVMTVAALLLLSLSQIGPHLVMMGVLTLIALLGILSPTEALAGFSNEGLVTVAAMFVVAAGIHASGGVDLIVNRVLGRPDSIRGALTRMFAPVVILSAFLNNTPVVATMIPAINTWCRRINISPSKLMIPLSYMAILGGTLTLIGTSTNLIINGQYKTLTGQDGFSLFSITAVGLPVAIVGSLFIWLVLPRLLPERSNNKAFGDMREFTLEVTVARDGPLVGKSIVEAGLRHLQRIYLVEIERGDTLLTAVPSQERLQGGDRLIFAGDTQAISDLLRINGIVASDNAKDTLPFDKKRSERRLVEAVVSPHCSAVGEAIRDARFRDRYGAVVLAVARNGERVKGNLGTIILETGDILLLEARPAFVSRQRYNKDFLLISELEEAPPRHEKAYLAWGILLAVVICAGFGLTSMLNAALTGAGLMIISACCSVSQAEKSLDLTVILTIAASFALGLALQKTGVASFLAEGIIGFSNHDPVLLLILCYAAVALLTEIITNNAAALIMLPIVLDITEKSALNQEPFIFAIMMAASASFATPIGYQTNLMVYGPGGYRFSDFLKVGLPMNLLVGATTLLVLIAGWPLQG
ncbi:MAG: SLC13 family permease [Parahaliea sp.]